MADDLARFFGLAAFDLHARELVPAVRTHRLEFGVALEGRDGLGQALLTDEDEAEPVPGAVELRIEGDGAPERVFGLVEALRVVEQESEVEPVGGAAARMRGDERTRVFDRAWPVAPCARRWARLESA